MQYIEENVYGYVYVCGDYYAVIIYVLFIVNIFYRLTNEINAEGKKGENSFIKGHLIGSSILHDTVKLLNHATTTVAQNNHSS